MKGKKRVHAFKNRMEHWQVVSIGLTVYDAIAMILAFFLALWFRFDCRYTMIPKEYLNLYFKFILIYAVISIFVFRKMRLYNSIWRFASYSELLRTVVATGITFVIHCVGMNVFFGRMPLSYYVFGIMIQFVLTLGVRFSYRFVLLERSRQRKAEEIAKAKKVLLIGAGKAGQMILRDIKTAKELEDVVCCIIDDNPNKWGRYIEGVPVVGGRDDILSCVERFKIEKIVVAIPSATAQEKRDILKALRVLDEDEDGVLRPTLAGLLALGFYPQKHFPRLSVSFAAYPGTTKATLPETGQRFLDSNDFVGPIPVMIAEAVAAVAKNMRTGSFFEGAFREDVPDYPQEAVREAVANALMHRDYSPEAWGAQVQVNMYADRLEILNPGGLYGSVTVDTLGTLGLSSSRNEFLSKILGSTPYAQAPGKVRYVVENKGSGYAEIETQLAAAYMEPPKPRDRPGSFSLTFCKRRLTPSEQHDYSNENIENAILAMATERETISAKEVEEASRLSRGTVLKHINNLIRQGSLEATEPGSSRKKRYRLTRP